MSAEDYVLRVQRETNPSAADRLAQGALSLLEKAYIRGVTKRREKETAAAVRAGVPVLSVGNLTAGGTGKTPCIAYLASLLSDMGKCPAILTRGYKGGLEKKGGLVSNREKILVSQQMAGDEPYMLAKKLPGVPVIAGRDRTVSAAAAKALGADVLLLDDGFQYWKLSRDLDLVLIDATDPFGGGRVLPRGLLREPMDALSRAGLFLLTKAEQASTEEKEEIRETLSRCAPGVPVLECGHVPKSFTPLPTWPRLSQLPEEKIKTFLLSGIGNPKAFEKTAEEAGLIVKGSLSLPDHHSYTEADLQKASDEAKASGADCITVTEKDAVKIKENVDFTKKKFLPLCVLGIEMEFQNKEDEMIFKGKIEETISSARSAI